MLEILVDVAKLATATWRLAYQKSPRHSSSLHWVNIKPFLDCAAYLHKLVFR